MLTVYIRDSLHDSHLEFRELVREELSHYYQTKFGYIIAIDDKIFKRMGFVKFFEISHSTKLRKTSDFEFYFACFFINGNLTVTNSSESGSRQS